MSGAQYGILDQNDKGKCRSNCSLRPRVFIWMLLICISHLVLLFTLSPMNHTFSRCNTFEMSNFCALEEKKPSSFPSVPHLDVKPHLSWAEVLLPEKQHVAGLVWWPCDIPGIQWRRLLRTFCATLEWIPQPGSALTHFHPSPAMHVAAVFHLFLMRHSGGGNLVHKHLPHHLWFHWRTSLQQYLFVTKIFSYLFILIPVDVKQKILASS